MLGQLLTIVAVLVATIAGLAGLFVLGWRAKSGLVLGPIVWFSKRFMNPRQMATAGQPGAYAGVVRHVGRQSGTAYETPVGIVAAGDDLLVALPYGTRSNWVRNVLAAGTATLVFEGETIEVDRAELISLAGVASRFSASDQPLFKVLHVDQALRLRRAEAGSAVVAA